MSILHYDFPQSPAAATEAVEALRLLCESKGFTVEKKEIFPHGTVSLEYEISAQKRKVGHIKLCDMGMAQDGETTPPYIEIAFPRFRIQAGHAIKGLTEAHAQKMDWERSYREALVSESPPALELTDYILRECSLSPASHEPVLALVVAYIENENAKDRGSDCFISDEKQRKHLSNKLKTANHILLSNLDYYCPRGYALPKFQEITGIICRYVVDENARKNARSY